MAAIKRQRWGVRLISYRFIMGSVARRPLDDERGSALPELAIAMLVLSVAILGVVGSMGLSMQLVGSSRQQSSGVSVAAERLERIHAIPYDRIALNEMPTHEADDPNHPNHAVSDEEGTYTIEDGTAEPLVYDPANGALSHIDDPITVGKTEFTIYQYVTAPPSSNGYLRVTVVVVWKYPVQSGTTSRAVQSTLISPGTVTVTAPPPSATPTLTPGPTATPVPDCESPGSGWGTGGGRGTLDIISGSGAETGYTASTSIQVTLDPKEESATGSAELRNVPSVDWVTVATWDTSAGSEDRDPATGNLLPATITWTIPPGDGAKSIEARFRSTSFQCSLIQDLNSAGQPAQITLDQTVPDPAPAALRLAPPPDPSGCTTSGPERTVGLTWDGDPAQIDDNFLGYRLYRSIDSGPYEAVSTVGAAAFASDTSPKSHSSVRYIVRAYDRAGNESVNSNVISFSKNSC